MGRDVRKATSVYANMRLVLRFPLSGIRKQLVARAEGTRTRHPGIKQKLGRRGHARRSARNRRVARRAASKQAIASQPFVPCVTTHKGVLDRTAGPLILRYRLVAMCVTHALRHTVYGNPRSAPRTLGRTIVQQDAFTQATRSTFRRQWLLIASASILRGGGSVINESDVIVGIGGAAGDGVASAGNIPGTSGRPVGSSAG